MEQPLLPDDRSFHGVSAVVEDSGGSLWIGGGFGLRRRLPDGRFVVYREEPKDGRHIVDALLFAKRNQLWVGSRTGLMMIQIDAASIADAGGDPIVRTISGPGVTKSQPGSAGSNGLERARWFTTADGLPYDHVSSLYLADDGRIRAGTVRGLARCCAGRHRLAGMTGIEGIKLLKARYPNVAPLVLTVYGDDARIFAALCAGACGYLLKKTPPARLLDSLREAVDGGFPTSPEVARRVIALFARSVRPRMLITSSRLTKRVCCG